MRTTLFCALFLFCTIFNGVAKANLHPNSCQFGIQGEYLYLQPNVNANSFATELISSTTIKSLLNSPGYSSGFRVEGVYAFDCLNDIHGRFTYFNSGHNKRSVTSTFISPLSITGTITDEVKFRYYAAEVLYGRWLFDCCHFDLELQGGILYSNIRFNDHVTVSNSSTSRTGHSQSKFWGIGPEIVLNFLYPFPICNLAFAFDARSALLISRTEAFVFGADGFNLLADPFHGVTPASDLRLGLNWRCFCGCLKLSIDAGYEWIYYHRAFIQSTFSENISFQGPYFALGLIY